MNAIPSQASESPLDVLIVGAGMSGIGLACTLARELPAKTWAIVEARETLGGTWDLFRYPGHPLRFRPLHLRLRLQAVDEPQGDRRRRRDPRLSPRGCGRAWRRRQNPLSAQGRRRRLGQRRRALDRQDRPRRTSARRRRSAAAGCSARPAITTTTRATARISRTRRLSAARSSIRRHWPEDFDATGKRIAVIGSGATAVTLVPALADTAAHVTQIQRTPELCPADPVRGRDRQPPAPMAAGEARPCARAAQEHPAAAMDLRAFASATRRRRAA